MDGRAHVYCRRGATVRYAIDHAELAGHPAALPFLHAGSTPCELHSLIFTMESGIVCVALREAMPSQPSPSQPDDATATDVVTTYVLQIPRHDVDVVVDELERRGVVTACVHYAEGLEEDIRVHSQPPEDAQLVGATERPCLPHTAALSVATLRALSMISYGCEHHILPRMGAPARG